jgi:hypothetical protein
MLSKLYATVRPAGDSLFGRRNDTDDEFLRSELVLADYEGGHGHDHEEPEFT